MHIYNLDKEPQMGMQMRGHMEVTIGWGLTHGWTSLRLQAGRTSLYDMTHLGSGVPEFTSQATVPLIIQH